MKTIFFSVLFLSLLRPSHSQSCRFSADDVSKIVRITDPQISADGKTVAVVVSRANMSEDRWDSEIAAVDIATGESRVMTHEQGVSSPRWSPDGDRLAYLAQDVHQKTQVFVLHLTGGNSMQVTRSRTSVTLLAWKPDGSALAFAAADEEPERKGDSRFEDAFEVGNNNYLERSRVLPVHIWLIPATGGDARKLTSGEWSLPRLLAPTSSSSQISFTPDGRQIVFVKAITPISGDSDSSRVQLLDLTSGAIRALTPGKAEQVNPVPSPDGSRLAYLSPKNGKIRNVMEVFVAPVAEGAVRDATLALDRNVENAAWMPDGRSLLVAANDDTQVSYWVQPIDGKAKKIQMGKLTPSTTAVTVAKDGGIAFIATSQTHPAELFYIAHTADTPKQLTHLQTVTDGMELGRIETVRWRSDRFDIGGVLTYPPDYVVGKKYPLVLYIHGGPAVASVATFSPYPQMFAARGWLVLEPNYRGSNNHGNEFQTAIERDAGRGPGRDIVAGVEAIKKLGIVDETKIAVGGWSYGGMMTAWLIGNYPSMWRAAVAAAPVTDFLDEYTLSDGNVQRAALYGPSPFVGDNMKTYAVQSPITYAWRVRTPTLIMSDVGDWRITTTQAYKLYHALKDNNVPVKFIAYPVAGHAPADPIRFRDVWRRWTFWLATYLDGSDK